MPEPIRIRDTYPGDKKLQKHLRKLKKTINEGLKNKNVEYAFITASIVEVRHILEHILGQYWIKIGKGKVKADPFEQINELKNRGVLTKEQASFLHEVRLAANSEVHNSNNRNKKIATMSDMVKLGNELSDFIVNKFKKDIPKKLSPRGGNRPGGNRPIELIKNPSIPEKYFMSRAQMCLDRHIISRQEYERVLPTAGKYSFEIQNASLKKLRERILWESDKILEPREVEKRIKERGPLSKEEKQYIAVSEKSRKKEAEYKKHDVSFLKIILDSLYPGRLGAPWIRARVAVTTNRVRLYSFGCREWLFQADIPEKRKEKIERIHKAAFPFAIAMDCLAILLSVFLFLWLLYFAWSFPSDVFEKVYLTIAVVIMLGGFLYSFIDTLRYRIDDWWRRYEEEKK